MDNLKGLVEDTSSSYSRTASQSDNIFIRQDVERQAVDDTNTVEKSPKDSTNPNIVNWDGPDDPANPMNWSSGKKVGAIAIVSLITLLSPLASTIIAPATEEIMKTFHTTNETLGAFITSIYLLGYAFGPLVIAPLSEVYGRALLYNVCNTIFFIFSIACAVPNNLAALIVFRFLAGIGASCPLTLGAGTISDMIPLHKRGLAMACWIMGPLIGPAVGPLVGAYLSEAKGWRWIFWLITILAGVIWIANVIFMRESYGPVLLQWKAKRLQKETGNTNLRSALDNGRGSIELIKFSLVRPIKMLIFSPIVFLMSLYVAIVYGYTYLLFTTFPRVFQAQYGFSSDAVGLTYLGIGVGSFFGLMFCAVVSDRLVKSLTERNGGSAKPEYRLPSMFVGTFLVPIGLFLYGWTAEHKVHWMLPIIGTALLGFGLFAIIMPTVTYLVDAFTIYAASVTAALTVLRSLLGALLPLAGNSMYDKLGLGWGTSVLGFIAVAFIPVPLVFWRYGERIRESKHFQVKF